MTGQGDLRWGVKSSFLRYVRVIAAGQVSVAEGAVETPEGGFAWPLVQARRDGVLELSFSGSVHFWAHGGFLDVRLGDPVLRLTGHRGTLAFVDAQDGQSRVVADIGGDGAESDAVRGPTGHADALIPRLTAYGAELFGSVYPVGTAFDALVARMPAMTG